MKKTALLALSLFVASQAQAMDFTSKFNVSPQVKGIAKLASSASCLAYSLLTLKNGWMNFRASRPVAQDGYVSWRYKYIPVPTYFTSAADKTAERSLSKYQFGTTGFAALLAKQLYDSGMSDLSSDDIS